MSRRLVAAFVSIALASGLAHAETADEVSPKWLIDGGAIPFLWLPLIGTVVADTYVAPREQPLLFDPMEGGQESRRENEVPGYALTLAGIGVATAFMLGDDASRFYHAKGLGQSLATSGLIAVSAKRFFGRHRPDYAGTDDGRRSFPSGHTTRAFSVLTYSALYLRYHGFDQWRAADELPWWELGTYMALGALAVTLAGERVYHNRHHVGDVIAGGLLGGASSAAFFAYQERRYRRANREVLRNPPILEPADGLPAIDGPTVSFGGSF